MRILLFILTLFLSGLISSSVAQAQIRYNGPTVKMEAPVSISGLQFAGVAFKDIGMKFPGSDTLNNAKLCFTRSTIADMKEMKLTLIVRKGIMIQFQINTIIPEQVKALDKLCQSYYGKPKKTTVTKTVTMVSWETEKNGNLIQTFLITGNNFKKAELVSWVAS